MNNDRKFNIRRHYWDCLISHSHAIQQLMSLGFTEFAAEEFLNAEGQ